MPNYGLFARYPVPYMDEVQFYLDHSEPRLDPPRRVLFEFPDSSYCILLLNEFATYLVDELVSISPSTQFEHDVNNNKYMLQLSSENLANDSDEQFEPKKIKSWFVYCLENHESVGHHDLVIFSKSSSQKQILPQECGYIITGKENLMKNLPLKSIRALSKSEKTPFIADKYGDSWNDSFALEPRMVETIPQSVFDAIESILEIAKKCFMEHTKESTEAAAEKYRKAFHYCHTYYPDDLTDEELQTFTDLKIKSLLNLALVGLKTENREWFKKTVESCDFVLGMPELATRKTDEAKAYYRRGYAYMLLGDEDRAEKDLKKALSLVDDEGTKRALRQCSERRIERNQELRKRMKLF